MLEKLGFIPVFPGLIDGEHRQKAGLAIFTYQAILGLTYYDTKGRQTGKVVLKMDELAKDTKQSYSTVDRDIERLVATDYIKVERQQYGLLVTINKWKTVKQRLQVLEGNRKEQILKNLGRASDSSKSPKKGSNDESDYISRTYVKYKSIKGVESTALKGEDWENSEARKKLSSWVKEL